MFQVQSFDEIKNLSPEFHVFPFVFWLSYVEGWERKIKVVSCSNSKRWHFHGPGKMMWREKVKWDYFIVCSNPLLEGERFEHTTPIFHMFETKSVCLCFCPNPQCKTKYFLCLRCRGGRYVLKIHFFIESGQKMIQFKIQFKPKSKIFIQKNIHSTESRIFNKIIHS